MSRILGNLKDGESVFVCRCGCVFTYEDNDVNKKTEFEADYWGGTRWETEYVVCPKCSKESEIGYQ